MINNISNNIPEIYQLHWIGRFGNRIFQYMFVNEWARRNGGIAYIPSKWEGTILFKKSQYSKILTDNILRLEINQIIPEFNNKKYRKEALIRYNKRNNTNILFLDTRNIKDNKKIAFDDLNCMYFRNMHKKMNLQYVKQLFEFNDNIKNLDLYKDIFNKRGTYIIAHLRRGDIASHNYIGNHSMITKKSYFKALKKFGDNEKEIIWISDNINERTPYPSVFTKNYYNLSNGHKWLYPMGEIVQNNEIVFDFLIELILLKFAKKIYRGNSSFSWFGSFISNAKIYSPVLKSKPINRKNKYYKMECDFVEGNKEPFMGSKEEGFEELYIE